MNTALLENRQPAPTFKGDSPQTFSVLSFIVLSLISVEPTFLPALICESFEPVANDHVFQRELTGFGPGWLRCFSHGDDKTDHVIFR